MQLRKDVRGGKRMRKRAIVLFAVALSISNIFGNANVSAATKEIRVNQIYENSTKITGKSKKNTIIKVKIGKKTYKTKTSKNGKYILKIPKAKADKTYTVKAFQGKKMYAKKKVLAKHLYNIPVYKKVHYKEKGHWEIVKSPSYTYNFKLTYMICETCGKNLTQEYMNAIIDGSHTLNEISYEDYLKNGGWDHSCKNHKIGEKVIEESGKGDSKDVKMWVIDQAEHDEKVLVGYRCKCGKIRKK